MPHSKYSAAVRQTVYRLRKRGYSNQQTADIVRKKFPEHALINADQISGLYFRQCNGSTWRKKKTEDVVHHRAPAPISLAGPDWSQEGL